MSEMASWGLIGYGNIGQELKRQLAQPAVAERNGLSDMPDFVIRSSGIMAPDGVFPAEVKGLHEVEELPDVTFVALPSTNDGMVAYNYIEFILEAGKMAVTAEKGSMANFFGELREASDDFSRLAFNACVGGGTRLIEIAKVRSRDIGNISEMHLVVNGTLTAIMSSIAPPGGVGMSLGQAVHQAVTLGYAEPGASNPRDVIRQEAEGDIAKKTAIFFNALGLSRNLLDWRDDDLSFGLSDEQISRVVAEARIRRFIISIYSEKFLNNNEVDNDIIGGFDFVHDGWGIVGGFRHIERNPLFSNFATLTGPGNGIVIGLGPDNTDGTYNDSGPGAGARPTANTMIDDFVALRRQASRSKA